jgi:NAD(P)-dependent dehydrogenase (short-subunit alcohol dehydrogenase family)
MTISLDGKTILITGGTSGIGKATASSIISGGGHVIIVGRDEDKMADAAKELGEDFVTPISADVSDLKDLDRLFEKVKSKHGGIDGLFANAGYGRFMPFKEVSEDDFDNVFAVNVKGVFFTIQKALPILKKPASIVVTASWTSHLGLEAGVPYAATKGALNTMVKTMTSELRGEGIRINSVSPGMIATPAIEDMEDKERTFWKDQIPADRFGEPEDIGKVVAFLLSDEAGYVAGEDILIDGGLSRTIRMSF